MTILLQHSHTALTELEAAHFLERLPLLCSWPAPADKAIIGTPPHRFCSLSYIALLYVTLSLVIQGA